MKKNYIPFFLLLLTVNSWSQEIQIFKVNDFDLNGKVKSCLVITDYGRELYEFDKEGFLTKTVTQYNDEDQDITYYKYDQHRELLEKRMESYKDKLLDETTSMANFYTIDTVPQRKILEKIISYDKEFLEQQEYAFDEENRVVKITTSNEGGVDETTMEYITYKDEITTNILINEVMEKSIRTSERKRGIETEKNVLTKEYIDGEPNKAVEKVFNGAGKLVSEEVFMRDIAKKKFTSERKMFYVYDTDGMLSKVTTKTENSEFTQEYIFQFDSNLEKNWIKKIITPDNTYTTRRITYYPTEKMEEKPN
ncbi:hypothetical protein [Flagellimonas pacifica]|uniref:Uncharacterized protein n=1 Tax=Flagellimonas pacifica TaxID=1247520 RepID=A0A285MRE0_9FLAO|nr:hypothetical protein [Allomuricauda parva]SNY99742.1 hypothetical protein SAMN06265377_1555 [Allomuricauda parva]